MKKVVFIRIRYYLSLVLSRRTFTSNFKPSKVIIWGMLFFTTGTSKLLPNSSGLTLIMMELSPWLDPNCLSLTNISWEGTLLKLNSSGLNKLVTDCKSWGCLLCFALSTFNFQEKNMKCMLLQFNSSCYIYSPEPQNRTCRVIFLSWGL